MKKIFAILFLVLSFATLFSCKTIYKVGDYLKIKDFTMKSKEVTADTGDPVKMSEAKFNFSFACRVAKNDIGEFTIMIFTSQWDGNLDRTTYYIGSIDNNSISQATPSRDDWFVVEYDWQSNEFDTLDLIFVAVVLEDHGYFKVDEDGNKIQDSYGRDIWVEKWEQVNKVQIDIKESYFSFPNPVNDNRQEPPIIIPGLNPSKREKEYLI